MPLFVLLKYLRGIPWQKGSVVLTGNISMSRNIISNVGGYVVSVIVAFLIAPITIHTLGDTRYGAWLLVSELIGYYGLLDLGIRGAVTYHVSRYSALNQQQEIQQILSSAFWMLSACGLLAFLLGIGFTIGFPYLFKHSGYDLSEVRQSLLIMASLISFSLPMNAFNGGLVGKQRFDIVSGVEVVNRILTALLTYISLKSGGGLVALALVQATGRIFSWGGTLYACRTILGGIFIKPKLFNKECVRELMGYGFRNAIGQVALLVIYRMDLLVVGIFAGINRVVYYSIASSLVSYASSLCSNIAFSFTPRFTQLESKNETSEINRLYFFGMRITGVVVVSMVSGILIFGKDFIKLWLGLSYVNGPVTDRSDIILSVLILANLPHMLQNISRQRLFGTGRVRLMMWLNICEAFANLSLSIFLVRRYGPLGVALGTFFPLLISQLIIMPIYSCKVFNISLWQLIRQGFAVPIIVGLLTLITNLACVHIKQPTTWLILGFEIIFSVIIGCIFSIWIGFNKEERLELLMKIYKKP